MELLYKPDWEQARQRYEAWWAHEYFGRPLLWVTAPKSDSPPGSYPEPPRRVEDRWLDLDYVRAVNDFCMPWTYYGADSFPMWHAGFPGWSSIACFMGCEVELSESTGWIEPIIDKGELTDYDYRDYVVDPENHWWKLAQDFLRSAAEESKGKSIPATGAFGGSGDSLAWLRSTNQLIYDVLDCPDYVREFEIHLMHQWFYIFDTFHEILKESAGGSAGWFPLWAPGKFYAAQNDFSYMISPTTFREVFLPAIETQTEFLTHTLYHVDGIGAFVHVDALCELPRLQAIQILPGAGKPSPLHYMDVLKKVQGYGKNLHITIPATEVRYALENLSARGLCIYTWCETEEEARALEADVEKWSVDRG